LRVILADTEQDTIAIHPSNFGVPPEQALTAELNKKYANRVLFDVGLCICVFDIAEAGEGKVRYGDGFLWYNGRWSCSTPDERLMSDMKSRSG
jgi:DNA-directed RNA polymerase III subunit RPC8